jgi:hypothetical protein
MARMTFELRPQLARRLPDPNFKNIGIERHIFVVPSKTMPSNLPLDPNARRPNTNRRVYKIVEDSLLNRDCEPNTFHLKNKGITIVADSVRQVQGNGAYEVVMISGKHGIVDGGHTYSLIQEHRDDPELPDNQFITVEVLTGVPDHWIPDIAGGLNTSVQVQEMSLQTLAGKFEWLKMALKGQPFYPAIAWSENDPGEYDARDIISFLTMFNVALFPNSGDEHPIMAYEKKKTALDLYKNNQSSYERMKPILLEILTLHDRIRKDYVDIWNRTQGGRAGNLAFSERRKKGKWDFTFIRERADFRMMTGALYPILASFRWYVVQEHDGTMHWREEFTEVLKAWEGAAPSLLKATYDMSKQLGYNANAVGKSRPHWSNLHNIVMKKDMMPAAVA